MRLRQRSHGTVLDVQGRTSEIFRLVDGTEVHPVLFSTAIGANRGVADYQVRAGAGPATKVCLRTVDEIPRHAITGKAARFIPERSVLASG